MSLEVVYMPSFIRQFDGLPHSLQEEALEKIEEFRDSNNHKKSRVHPLQGRLAGRFSFRIDYKNRIVFRWYTKDKKTAVLLAVGDHDVYR